MEIKYHLIAGLLLFMVLFPFFGIKSIIALFTSVFIDFDHIIWYVFRNKKFDLDEIIHYPGNDHAQVLCIFHTLEFVILLGILSFFSNVFLIIFIATAIHLFMDYMDWFIWFSIYSKRIPSIILWPLIYRRSKMVKNWIKKIGGKCVICGFNKAFDIHFIFGDKIKAVLLCPNHHYLAHRDPALEKKLLRLSREFLK